MNAAPLLALKHLDVYYERSHVLQNVTLAVPDGGVVTLLGRNGAGKSTLLKT
ncbi:MAG: ATP-binding cassette domain-containing protein, partial [Gammaproteobacteria bacterium]